MSKIAFAVVALTAAGFAGSAQAADLYGGQRYGSQPYYPAVQPRLEDCWIGPYLGGNIGYAWGSVDNNPTKPSGFVGGVQAGYNWQSSPSSPWVFGVEGDIQATGADDTFAPWKFSNPWFGTVRGRAGYALNNVLLFGTGGIAYGGVHTEGFGLTEDKALTGWTAGGGVEVGLARNWSARIEYLFVSLNDRHFVVTGTTNGLDSSLFRLGVDFRF